MAKVRHELRRKRDAVELALFTGAPVAGDEVRRTLEVMAVEVGGDEARRVDELASTAEGKLARGDYRERWGVAGVRRFVTAGGATIYLMAVETFPDHVNNVYLVREGARATLYDCGSQTHLSQQDLTRAQMVLARVFEEPRGLDDVGDLVLSHAHIDHFGGVGFYKARGVRVHVHEFDARVITRFEERIIVAAMQVRVFLERAGVEARTRTELEQMYVFTKSLFKSVPVDRVLGDGDAVNGYVRASRAGALPGAGVHAGAQHPADGRSHPAAHHAAPVAREHHAVDRARPLPLRRSRSFAISAASTWRCRGTRSRSRGCRSASARSRRSIAGASTRCARCAPARRRRPPPRSRDELFGAQAGLRAPARAGGGGGARRVSGAARDPRRSRTSRS